jgi:hypothetical protein
LEKRKSGASAFDEPVRDFSRKQKKRKVLMLKSRSEKVDHGKLAIGKRQAEKIAKSPSTQKMLQETRKMQVFVCPSFLQ